MDWRPSTNYGRCYGPHSGHGAWTFPRVCRGLTGRSLFSLSNGFLGLGPRSMEIGGSVYFSTKCVLFLRFVPFLFSWELRQSIRS